MKISLFLLHTQMGVLIKTDLIGSSNKDPESVFLSQNKTKCIPLNPIPPHVKCCFPGFSFHRLVNVMTHLM